MARRSDLVSRDGITEKVDEHRREMDEKAETIEQDVSDIDTVRETLDQLEGGTAEGADDVGQSIEAAESVGTGEFEAHDGELEQVQGTSEQHEQEVQDRSETVSEDLGRISDASGRIQSDAMNNELIGAKEAAIRDQEFLDEQSEQEREAREESRRLQEQYRAQVEGGRRS
jgi:hypothetical protein